MKATKLTVDGIVVKTTKEFNEGVKKFNSLSHLIRNLQKKEFTDLANVIQKETLLKGETLLGKNGVLCSAKIFLERLPEKFRTEDGEAQYRRWAELKDEETGLPLVDDDGTVLVEEKMTIIRSWSIRTLWKLLAQRQAWLSE